MACKGFDEQVVRLDKEIAELAKQFVLVRITNMRGVDLNRFDFDYDLTWVGLFMNAEGHTYGRFGGRDAGDPEKHLTVPALRYAMQRALTDYRRSPHTAPTIATNTKRTVEDYPTASRIKAGQCIHCHQVYDFRRDALRAAGQWSNEKAYVYPLPQTLGLTLEDNRPDVVQGVREGSEAERAGIAIGDTLLRLNGQSIASFLDVLYALEKAPDSGVIAFKVKHGTTTRDLTIRVAPGWKKHDISWRASMWGLQPTASVYGEDLKPEEKRALGLPSDALAFSQGDYVPPAARSAGIQAKDIILGIEGEEQKTRGMTMLRFNLYVRMTYKPGAQIVYLVVRKGQRLRIPVHLAERD